MDPLQKKLIEAEAHLSVFTAALSKREIFKANQLETSDHESGPWRDLISDQQPGRYIRVKPTDWNRELIDREPDHGQYTK